MMLSRTTLVSLPLAFASVAHADLTCLGWGVINPWLGVVCAFKPEPFHKVEEQVEEGAKKVETAVVSTIEQTAEELKDLGEFDLTHNPATLAYNYVDTAIEQGISQANTNLVDKLDDFVDVSIGFGKAAVNTAVTILEWTTWTDFWYCTFEGAIHAHRNMTAPGAEIGSAGKVQTADAQSVMKKCAGEKWERMKDPLVFKNITNPNQKVGGTIFDIATLLVPAGEGAKAGEAVLEGGYDLVIAGAEDSSRIVKWLPEQGEGVAGSFASEEEALAVKEKLKTDPNWPSEHCAMCNAKPGLGGRSVLRRRLAKRGPMIEVCCIGDDAHLLAEVRTNVKKPEMPSLAQGQQPQKAVFKSLGENGLIQTENLVPPPETLTRNIAGDGIKLLEEDLLDNNLGVVSWPEDLLNLEDSETFLSSLRGAFEEGESNPLWSKLKLETKNARAETISDRFMASEGDALFKPIQTFAQKGMDFAVDASKRMFGSKIKYEIEGYMEIFWTPASTEADITSATTIGGHADPGLLIFSSADQPGLVLKLADGAKATRIIPKKNTFQIIKGGDVGLITRKDIRRMEPTWHYVFGPEIAQHGRVSFLFGARFKRPLVKLAGP